MHGRALRKGFRRDRCIHPCGYICETTFTRPHPEAFRCAIAFGRQHGWDHISLQGTADSFPFPLPSRSRSPLPSLLAYGVPHISLARAGCNTRNHAAGGEYPCGFDGGVIDAVFLGLRGGGGYSRYPQGQQHQQVSRAAKAKEHGGRHPVAARDAQSFQLFSRPPLLLISFPCPLVLHILLSLWCFL